ncbi:MAG: DNA methylase [Lachnospiraceae bacterium]|nr:DNA methylase [Lachnospiraceae bacterium]
MIQAAGELRSSEKAEIVNRTYVVDRQQTAGRTYLAIDLKSFFATCECGDRHLDPLTTNLVVADESRTEKTICLAVSPSLKAYGIPGRPRLFEVIQQVKAVNEARIQCAPGHRFTSASFDAAAIHNDPSLELSYIVAPPRMARYVETSAQIYSIYLRYIAPEDIFAYSIDEVFIDATAYLSTYCMTAHELTMTLIREVLYATGITATGGIGSNLYLAKVAMDIVAKHVPADKDGVRIAELAEQTYREQLWSHRPLTDFWRVGHATARKLEKHCIYTMGDLARCSLYDQNWFYKTFGIDAEILIDHAWGIEPVGMEHIKNYKSESTSLSEGQVLSEPYPYEKARIIVQEMADSLVQQLVNHEYVTDLITLDISYDRENVDSGSYSGSTKIDHYGRAVPRPAHGSTRLDSPSNLGSQIIQATTDLFDRIADRRLTVRRINVSAGNLTEDNGLYQFDLFTDTEALEKEKKLQSAIASIKNRYGKNAILKGTSFQEGATMRERNGQIGGHRSGE